MRSRRRGIEALGAAALLLLSACAGAPGDRAEALRQVAATPSVSPAAAARLAATPTAAGKAPDLIGMSRADVARLLGTPTLLRSEPPAEVWQYAGAACVLHVFIYKDTGPGRVAHYEAVLRSGGALPARTCYADLLARRLGES